MECEGTSGFVEGTLQVAVRQYARMAQLFRTHIVYVERSRLIYLLFLTAWLSIVDGGVDVSLNVMYIRSRTHHQQTPEDDKQLNLYVYVIFGK